MISDEYVIEVKIHVTCKQAIFGILEDSLGVKDIVLLPSSPWLAMCLTQSL